MLDRLFHLITGSPAFQFLRTVAPFELLPDAEIDAVADALTIEYHAGGTTLFVQGQSRVEHLHVVLSGAVELVDETPGGPGGRQALLGTGQHHGGACMLLNDGVALLNARTVEDTFFYLLPRRAFLRLCERHPEFHDFFADGLGARLLDRIGRSVRHRWLADAAGEDQAVLFNRRVEQVCARDPLFCPPGLPIHEAAALLGNRGVPALLVGDEAAVLGVVTDRELRDRVVAARRSPEGPVSEIMSPAQPPVSADATLAEAVGRMVAADATCLPVAGTDGRILGLLTEQSLTLAHGAMPVDFIREIGRTRLRRDLAEKHRTAPRLVRLMMLEGVRVEGLTWIVSAIADTTARRLLELALEELGPAPLPFAFLVLGSEGRREQTLATDQDNALVYADPADDAEREVAERYFRELGERVCAWLAEAGWAYCPGEVMASNPRWCQPLSRWKRTFADWVRTPEPEAVMRAAIFFDLREAYGDVTLAAELRDYVFGLLAQEPALFFHHLARSALRARPPLGFFGNVLVEKRGGRGEVLDVKDPVANLSDYVRLEALCNGVRATNTLERLSALGASGALDARTCRDASRAWSFLTQLRLARQVAVSLEGREPDNLVGVGDLAPLERRFLEESFKLIERLQGRLERRYPGVVG